MDIAAAPGPEDCLPHMQINNFALINAHFNKKKVIQRNMRKFFLPIQSGYYKKPAAFSISAVFLLPGFTFAFFSSKSTFIQVWEKGDIAEAMRQPSLSFKGRSDPLADEGLADMRRQICCAGNQMGPSFWTVGGWHRPYMPKYWTAEIPCSMFKRQ